MTTTDLLLLLFIIAVLSVVVAVLVWRIMHHQRELRDKYLIDVCEGVKIYPQVGYALAFVHQDTFTEGNVTIEKSNSTDGGAQLGLGAQFNIGESAFLLADYKFQPGIFGDCHVVNVGIGFRF